MFEKYYKPITVQYYVANCVSWVPWLTLLDLRTHSQNGTRSYVGDLLYFYLTAFFILSFSLALNSLTMMNQGVDLFGFFPSLTHQVFEYEY